MPLPILEAASHATPQTLIRLFHQTELNWARHLGEEHVLNLGTAIYSPDLSALADANLILGAALPDGAAPTDAIGEAAAFYHDKGARLGGLIPRPPADDRTATELAYHLSKTGWQKQPREIMRLAHRPTASAIPIPPEIKIIPARASFRHAKELAAEMTAGDAPSIDAVMLHLDDPHVAALLVLKGGRAVATVAVMAMGEVGRIDQLYVSENARRQGLGQLILSRAIEICARALFRHVLLGCLADAVAAALFRQFGFEPIGEIDSWRAPRIGV